VSRAAAILPSPKLDASHSRDPYHLQYVPALDGLRGLAGIVILIYHYSAHISAGAYTWMRLTPEFFFAGVDLFFVLSGFLIGRILLKVKPSEHYYATFYLRRSFRVLPVYFLLLFSYCVVGKFFAGPELLQRNLFTPSLPLWPYFLQLQNVSMAFFDTFGPGWMAAAWTLAVEEQFYFILPLVVRQVSTKQLRTLCILSIAAGFVFRGAALKVNGLVSNNILFCRMDSLAIGVLVAIFFTYHFEALNKYRKVIGQSTLIAVVVWPILQSIPATQLFRYHFATNTVNAFIFGGLIATILLLPSGRIARFFGSAFLRKFGTLSYSLYLFHPVALGLAFHFLRGTNPQIREASDLVCVAVALIVSLIAAQLSWTYFESPMLKVGKKFSY